MDLDLTYAKTLLLIGESSFDQRVKYQGLQFVKLFHAQRLPVPKLNIELCSFDQLEFKWLDNVRIRIQNDQIRVEPFECLIKSLLAKM